MTHASESGYQNPAEIADVAIVGAGPIGLELAVALQRAGLSYLLFDAGQIGETFTWWPRFTEFFSTPERIAIAGVPIPTVTQRRITGEEYLAYLRAVVEQFDLRINAYEKVIGIDAIEGGFRVLTAHRTGPRAYAARRVVLASGGMARPRRLGIPGEELPHVAHSFDTPHRYFHQRLLIVGGRNSAAEAALRCWRMGAEVAISYRRPAFDPGIVKQALLDELETLIAEGKIAFLPASVPVEITPEDVTLTPADEAGAPTDGAQICRPADFVLLATGYEADMELFRQAGVELIGREERPVFDPATMETNVPGIYVAGTATGGTQHKFDLFIETSHKHVVRIVEALGGERPTVADVPARNYGFFTDRGDRPVSHR